MAEVFDVSDRQYKQLNNDSAKHLKTTSGWFWLLLFIEYLLHLGLCNQLMAMLWLNCVVLYCAETKEQLNPM